MDMNGLADPYLIARIGKLEQNDKANIQKNELNPIFGKYVPHVFFIQE